jgi:hypothetical protein
VNVNIQIHYVAASRILQRGSFPLRGRKPEQVAYEFWKQIQKEMSYRAVLEEVIADGDQDITELVREIERKHLDGNLPF